MSEPTNPNSPNPEPAPVPSQAPAQDNPAPAAETGGTGLQPNVAAGLASIFSIIGGIIFIALEKKNAFVRFYAMQAIFLGGAGIALSVIATIAGLILGHFLGGLISLTFLIVRLAFFVFWIITIVKAFGGKEEWEIPVLGKLARQQLAKGAI